MCMCMCVYVYVCVRAFVRACLRACVCMCTWCVWFAIDIAALCVLALLIKDFY